MTVSSSDSNSTTRRNWLRGFAVALPSLLGGCAVPMGSSLWRLARVSVIIPMVVKAALGHMTCSIFMKHIVTIQASVMS